jgi:type II secretory pathway component GspD/PulD (secretin)
MTALSSARSLSVALLFASAILAGCASNDQASNPAPKPADRDHEVAPPGEENGGGGGGLADEERKVGIQQQEDAFIAEKLYEAAQAEIKRLEFAAALDNLEKARRLNPGSEKIRDAYNEVSRIMNRRPAEWTHIKRWAETELQVKIEQTRIEVENHFRQGERFMGDEQYEQAEMEFNAVVQKLKWVPYDIGMNDQLDNAKKRAQDAREKQKLYAEQLEEARRNAALKEAHDREMEERARMKERIRELMEIALEHFDNRRYLKAELVCDEILALVPKFRPAQELKEDAGRAALSKAYEEFLELRRERWKTNREDMLEASIPYAEHQKVRFPSEDEWRKVVERSSSLSLNQGPALKEDEEVLAIKNKLETTKIDLDFTDSTLYDIIEFIQEFAKINIVIAAEVRKEGIPEKKISFAVKDLVLKHVLRLLLQQYDLGYTFENRVLLITQPQLAEGKPVLEVHDVRDLLGKIPDFPGPSLELTVGEGGADPTTSFVPPEEEESVVSAEQLETLIKQNISPTSWTEREGEVSIALTGNQQLLVVHTPKVQEEIRAFLSNLRSFTGAMVSIEARFLTVTDDFLEDVGHEFRGLDATPASAVSPLQIARPMESNANAAGAADFSDGTQDVATTVPAGQTAIPEAGIFTREHYGDTDFYDIRMRTVYPLTAPLITNIPDFPLGTRLQNRGGIGLQYRILREMELNSVIRAVRKTQKASVVTAPRVTAFNGQRAHILIAQQQAYIQDYDVEIAQNSRAYDPVIGIVQDGLVLDVRPIISNDRKYITLEMRPTVAKLTVLRLFDITPDATADSVATPDTYIQLPTIDLQRAQTTVRMPDRGHLILAGLKNSIDRDLSSSTPFLSNLPLVGWLFRRKGKSIEQQNLIIIVSAEILDLADVENQQAFGRR